MSSATAEPDGGTAEDREIADGEYRGVLQELGAIEVQLESLKERRQELINELREDGLVGVRVTPVGDKIRTLSNGKEVDPKMVI